MQFVANGPDIPNELIAAHEDGGVVFFCGSGISRPARLPGFRGLVDGIYDKLGQIRRDAEESAYNQERFDTVLELLEERLQRNPFEMRRALASVLETQGTSDGATGTHTALLQLARAKSGATRLVTTNFDRLFEIAAEREGLTFARTAAPLLPVPKNSSWNSLVYLHGVLPDGTDDGALGRLVVTSGDFGRAYLTERWAARFLSELFRSYSTCFVGYGLNDPVLRYMMDALASDRRHGEKTLRAWAFVDCEPGTERRQYGEWEAKGTIPILYSVPTCCTADHSSLHRTLTAWSETYRDGDTGKSRIVASFAHTHPSSSTKEDDFVGRMLWAVSDKDGFPAKLLSELQPAPPLDWLFAAFTQNRFGDGALPQFGVIPNGREDPNVTFSLISRPAPFSRAPTMSLVLATEAQTSFDAPMLGIAKWLLRYLNDPRLLHWVAKCGAKLHPQWAELIYRRLAHLARLEREGKSEELRRLESESPSAVACPAMRALWRLLLSGRVKSDSRRYGLDRWTDRWREEGLTPLLRLELRPLLAPMVALRASEPLDVDSQADLTNASISQIIRADLVLATDNVRSFLPKAGDAAWTAALPELLEVFEQLLREATDLLGELGESGERLDLSLWHLPSISPHPQNRDYYDWVVLIELTRDAWLATWTRDAAHASLVAHAWFTVPRLTFKRLALFAASKNGCIPSSAWLEWLLSDGAWLLWAGSVKREVLRLLALQGAQLASPSRERLEAAIMAGPPGDEDQYRNDRHACEVDSHRPMWLRLAKLASSGASLGQLAGDKLEELSRLHPTWNLSADEREEFTCWMSTTADPDSPASEDVGVSPGRWRDLARQLRFPRNRQPSADDAFWRSLCATAPRRAATLLRRLARARAWPETAWSEALSVWSDQALLRIAWPHATRLLSDMPDEPMLQIVHSVSRWLRAGATHGVHWNEPLLLMLFDRVLGLALDERHEILRIGTPTPEAVNDAINHPIGHITEALLTAWFGTKPDDHEALPEEVRRRFTAICDSADPRFRHGRVILASRLVALYRADPDWTLRRLVSFFDWHRDPTAASQVWQGFLWSPRLHPSLFGAIKPQFLETAQHYELLGQHGSSFASLLTFAALDHLDGYTEADFRGSFDHLPVEGLVESARAVSRGLKSAEGERAEYWSHRVEPFLKRVWPSPPRGGAPEPVAFELARAVVRSDSAFTAAVETVLHWLVEIDDADFIIRLSLDEGLVGRFPDAALEFFARLVGPRSWTPHSLPEALDKIRNATPNLVTRASFQRLLEVCRRLGG